MRCAAGARALRGSARRAGRGRAGPMQASDCSELSRTPTPARSGPRGSCCTWCRGRPRTPAPARTGPRGSCSTWCRGIYTSKPARRSQTLDQLLTRAIRVQIKLKARHNQATFIFILIIFTSRVRCSIAASRKSGFNTTRQPARRAGGGGAERVRKALREVIALEMRKELLEVQLDGCRTRRGRARRGRRGAR